MSEYIGLRPDDPMGVYAILTSELGRVAEDGEKAETPEEKKWVERRLQAIELLAKLFLPLGIYLTHKDKTRFLNRIYCFFSETEKELGNIFNDNRFSKLHFDLLSFSLAYATNRAEKIPHITGQLQELLRKVDTAIQRLEKLQKAA